MKTIIKGKLWLLPLLILPILIWLVCQFGPAWVREIGFYLTSPTQAEQTVHAYAKSNGLRYSDYPVELIALLERNPETAQFVLEYPLKKDQTQVIDLSVYQPGRTPPLLLQWDQRWGYLPYGDSMAAITACGPMCLSMAAIHLTGSEEFTPEKIIAFAEDSGYYASGFGSSWTLISEGGEKLGFTVKELPLVKSRILKNLEAGNPVICVMGPGDFTTTGHFILIAGCEDGLLRIHDPNSIANSQKLWSYEEIEGQIKNLWAIGE